MRKYFYVSTNWNNEYLAAQNKSFKYDPGKFSRILINAISRNVFVELEVCKSLEDLLKRGLADRVVF